MAGLVSDNGCRDPRYSCGACVSISVKDESNVYFDSPFRLA